MPTYEYKCLDCGETFEVFQSMTEPRLSECRLCGGRVKRLIGAGAGIIFKGSGFYCTDYKKNNGGGDARKEKDGQPAAESKKTPEAKSETKAAASAKTSGNEGKASKQ
ncbi:MAG: zinc ribbon domain-containing protein [Kiritimatiellaeota bacterium]|nr:zinc ribbon domain-containing protein [Kiritimatiellota bacterium]